MSEWEPATDAEAAMRDALRTDDQESYFRILAGVDLLLPVSADALAGLAPLGWGTWSTGGRTHVLAFTSPAALQACLADYTGSARRVAYAELADTWPNLEWWLAVNPGLPIEGYLPAWFVAQLSRGDLRLPTRGPARDGGPSAASTQDLQAVAMAANAAAAGEPGGPTSSAASASGVPASGDPRAAEPGNDFGRGADNPGAGVRPAPAPADDRSESGQVGPGGLPVRAPGAVLPSGLPSRVPAAPQGGDEIGGFSGFATRGGARQADDSVSPGAGGSPDRGARDSGDAPDRPAPVSGAPDPSSAPVSPAEAASSASEDESSATAPAETASGGFSDPSPEPPATREPMASTPSPLTDADVQPSSPDEAAELTDDATAGEQVAARAVSGVPDNGSSLPRRQAIPASDRPASMAAAAQALAASRTPAAPGQTGQTAPGQTTPGRTVPGDNSPTRANIAPPVVPGAGGSGRSERTPLVPAPVVRPEIPPAAGPDVLPSELPPVSPAPATPSITQPDPGTPTQPDTAGASWPGISPGNSGTEDDDFIPANPVEQDLYYAADGGSTDAFLSTLLLATVLVPVADDARPGSSPGEPGFVFRTEELDGEELLVVFTSPDRLAEHFTEPTRTVGVKFLELIRSWPDPDWSFAVNPNTPVGAKYPGPQVIALASWATEAGLGADPEIEAAVAPAPLPQKVSDAAQHATVMQKTISAEQVDYYLDRGYDRVAGFVHRANEVDHLRTPAELFAALGLVHDGSPFHADAKEAFVLRWPAYRPSLYRIPYGGQSEQALRAMDGWVIERPPFRGNGFAPGEGRDVVAEFKVDSVRLPHGAQLWRMDADGNERMIAVYDCDAPNWRRVGEPDA